MPRAPLAPTAVRLNDDGARALASGDLDTAEARLGLALEYDRRFTEAWVNLGLVAMMRGKLQLARTRLLVARRLNPDLPTPHHALALVAEREGEAEVASRHYEAALAVDPGFLPSRLGLARAAMALGHVTNAERAFAIAVEIAPERRDAWEGLAGAALALGHEDAALHVVTRARHALGDPGALGLERARVRLARGEVGDALVELDLRCASTHSDAALACGAASSVRAALSEAARTPSHREAR